MKQAGTITLAAVGREGEHWEGWEVVTTLVGYGIMEEEEEDHLNSAQL